MTISTLKDLKNLIKLCQDTGVHNIKIDGIELQLSPTYYSNKASAKGRKTAAQEYEPGIFDPGPVARNVAEAQALLRKNTEEEVNEEMPSDEELLYYSSSSNELTTSASSSSPVPN